MESASVLSVWTILWAVDLDLDRAPWPQIVRSFGFMKVPMCLKVSEMRSPPNALSSADFSVGNLLSARTPWSQRILVRGPRTNMELLGMAIRWTCLVEGPSVSRACSVFFVRSVMTLCAPRLTFTTMEPRTISRVLERC